MRNNIKKKCENCESCRNWMKSNSKTKGIIPLKLFEFLPGEAWSCNIMTYKGKDYLIC